MSERERVGRFEVTTVVRSPCASVLHVADLTEFLAACHRHGFVADDSITVEHTGTDLKYFQIIGVRSVETHVQ